MFTELTLWAGTILGFVGGCWFYWTGLKEEARMLWLMAWVAFVVNLAFWNARN